MSASLGGSSGQGPHHCIPVGDPSRVGEARRLAADLCARIGMDTVTAARVALVVNELGNNLLRHASDGQLLVGARDVGGAPVLEILSTDGGPGMASPAACLVDGFSTAGSAGQGLGAVRRQADDFDLYSALGAGTFVLARFYQERSVTGPVRRPSPFESGAICIAKPHEQVSGDGWGLSTAGAVATLVVADGLGHGPDARRAADEALGVLAAMAASGAPVDPLRYLEKAHAAMHGTRGAALMTVQADAATATLRMAGAGNVMGRVFSGTHSRALMAQNGTVGVQLRTPREQVADWPPHSIVVLHSDGVQSRWQLDDLALLQRDPTLIAAYLYRKYSRGRDDTTVFVLRRLEN